MLPTVDFCGLKLSRLILGANPFAGFSHQSKQRDVEMRTFNTPQRILETWHRAEAAGITAMVTNNETEHVVQSVREYHAAGGSLQWIAQLHNRKFGNDMNAAIDDAVAIGAKAVYFHGAVVDEAYLNKDHEAIGNWCRHARSRGVPAGVAAHAPQAHFWVDSLDVADFHAVCFFNCGSVHHGKGEKFRLQDLTAATDCIRRLRKPCIGYKILGAGRLDPRMAFEYAFENIKPGDIVNVGMHRGDKDDMLEQNVALAQEFLGGAAQ